MRIIKTELLGLDRLHPKIIEKGEGYFKRLLDDRKILFMTIKKFKEVTEMNTESLNNSEENYLFDNTLSTVLESKKRDGSRVYFFNILILEGYYKNLLIFKENISEGGCGWRCQVCEDKDNDEFESMEYCNLPSSEKCPYGRSHYKQYNEFEDYHHESYRWNCELCGGDEETGCLMSDIQDCPYGRGI